MTLQTFTTRRRWGGRRSADIPATPSASPALTDPDAGGEVAVSVRGISKRYGHTNALRNVSVTIEPGKVHALVGENGAGKSTLGKIIAGVVAADEGEILVNGQHRKFRAPRDALAEGITIIDQEFALLWSHSVLENVFLGHTNNRGRRDRMREFEALQARVGFRLDPRRTVGSLRVAEQQQVEILRAVARQSRVVVMDEPTAALSRPEVESLMRLVSSLTRDGVAVVYVSHALEEVLAVADVISVLRDGEMVWTKSAADQTKGKLVTAMLGRAIEAAFPPRQPSDPDAPVVLSVHGMSRPGILHDISFDLRTGEILGLAGLVGSGRSEIAHAVFGADGSTGIFTLDGERWKPTSPAAAVKAGISLVPESRKEQGLMLGNSITYNLTLPMLKQLSTGGLINARRRTAVVNEALDDLDIRPRNGRLRVGSLSGGNQQKVLFARCLATKPRVLIVDEPTRGVDVGAKRAIYDLLVGLANAGCAILLISSELEEVLALSHRILVVNSGRLVAQLPGDVEEERLLQAMFDRRPSLSRLSERGHDD